MRVAVVLALALGMGCSKSTTPIEDSGSGTQRVVPALSGLIFDDKSGLCFVVGESIPFTGKATWHYANGQTMQETEFVDGSKTVVVAAEATVDCSKHFYPFQTIS